MMEACQRIPCRHSIPVVIPIEWLLQLPYQFKPKHTTERWKSKFTRQSELPVVFGRFCRGQRVFLRWSFFRSLFSLRQGSSLLGRENCPAAIKSASLLSLCGMSKICLNRIQKLSQNSDSIVLFVSGLWFLRRLNENCFFFSIGNAYKKAQKLKIYKWKRVWISKMNWDTTKNSIQKNYQLALVGLMKKYNFPILSLVGK